MSTINEYESQYEARYLIGCPVTRHKQRLLGIAAYTPPIGSRKLPCCACSKGVWISIEQYRLYEDSLDDGTIKPKCFNCAKVDLAKSDIVSLDARPGTYKYLDGTFSGPRDDSNN
jgi:hypothetical protein